MKFLRPVTTIWLVIVALIALPAQARDINVPGDYSTLQAALDASQPGDIIQLGRGTHQNTFVQLSDGITIRGDRRDPGQYVIDGGNAGRVFRAEGVIGVRLEGLTITGGNASGPSSYSASGGGIFISRSNVILDRVIFRENRAESSGGGMRAAYSVVQLLDCEFRDCTAVKGGGAVDLSYDSDVSSEGVQFRNNQAAWGGAISARTGSSCLFDSCVFSSNSAVPPQNLGGAFFADHAARVTFRHSILTDNAASQGGAARLTGALVGFTNCTIAGNSATVSGAGFMVRGGNVVLDHTIISNNNGTAMAVEDAEVWVAASDIHGNSGGDWLDPIANLRDQYENFSADPLYCDLESYTLQSGSPCAEDNNPAGLVGALPVGCENVDLVLQDFQARIMADEVVIDWTATGVDGHDFRLTGRSQDADGIPSWDVAYTQGSTAGRYTATDKPVAEFFPVIYSLAIQADDGSWTPLDEQVVRRPLDFGNKLSIHQVFPNPFNPQVTIVFSIPQETRVDAAVFDLMGRRVKTLNRGVLAAGNHELSWDSRDDQGRVKATGTYILRISGSGPALTRKLLLIK